MAESWLPCEDGWVKLTVCGICSDSKGAAGGVIRDSEGLLILGYAKNVETSSPLMAEFVAVYEGLKLAIDRRLKNVVVETEIIDQDKLLNNHYLSVATSEFSTIILDCMEMIKGEMTTQFTKIPAALNRGARSACAYGFLVNQLQVFQEIPDEWLRLTLLADFKGMRAPAETSGSHEEGKKGSE